MIESKDISVIVQGAINEYTEKCLLSIKKNFPNAQIILSTWEGSDVVGLNYDDVIFSEDPGAFVIDDVSCTLNNINRQIVSTKAGLTLAKRKYYLKTRTDIIWGDSKFLKYFGAYDKEVKPVHFKNRVLICNYYTRNPRVLPIPFHTSDWIAFGLAEDINLFYDIDCQAEEEMRWFKTHRKDNFGFYTNLLVKYVPEQYICLNFVKKFYSVNCKCFYDATEENMSLTEEILAKNFVVLDYGCEFGIIFPKYNPNKYFEKSTLICYRYWKELYYEYCLEKKSVFYYLRRVRNKLFSFLFRIRRIVLKILHKLHMKEKLKKILR